MQAVESSVAITLETKGFVVSPAVRTRGASSAEVQTHGYEVGDTACWLASARKAHVGGVDAEHQRGTDLKRWRGCPEAKVRASSR